MKNKRRDFNKFTKRNTHKRRAKDAEREELLRQVAKTGVNYAGVRIGKGAAELRSEVTASGVFFSSRQGFGFVRIDGADKDIFIPQDKTHGAIDGDLVLISYHSFTDRVGQEKTEGRVKKIIEYGRKTLVGTVEEEYVRHGRRRYRTYRLYPDEDRIPHRPFIRELMGAYPGDKVEVLILRDGTTEPACDVVRVFGDSESRRANYEAILSECEIEVDFTAEELREAENVARIPINHEGRTLRDREIIFTIDGEGAKDLDDAVSLVRTRDGFRLGVHIADVAEYVKEKTALDRAAMKRGTSIYFTDKVVPMLPPALSNGVCSLNAGEDKYAVSALIHLTREGEIKGVRLIPSVIRSRVRGVYSEVNAIFDGTASPELLAKYKAVIPTLHKMRELYEILLRKSKKRGFLDFDAPEAEIHLDSDGNPTEIIKRTRGIAERMIEQFMLAANEAVATRLYEEGIPCVYRVHEPPPADKLAELLNYLHNLGFDTSLISRGLVEAKDLERVLFMAEERGMLLPVSHNMLRAMSKARYSEHRLAHFGLSIDTYCHFTSPIRRLSDLATHRIIKSVLFDRKRSAAYAGYARRAAAAASEAELRALTAERRIENLYKVLYMKERLGEEFSAVVSGASQFGLFCRLDNTCEGLVPISEMPGEFFYDEKNITLRSRDEIYRVGDGVRVCLEEADIIRGKLRFSLVREVKNEKSY